jgi:hypothetical protein
MATKLARLSELYKPKSGDEQKFVAKHVTAKHDDVNGNKDDVFQATNVKTVEREKNRHGYAPGKDEEVYEEVEQVDEKLHSSATAGDYVKDFKKSDAPQFKGKSMKKRRQMAIAAFLSKGNMKEEVGHVDEEQLDELKKSTLLRYASKATKSSIGMGIKAARARDEDDMETWAKHRNKADMRDKGIMRAGRKLREGIDSDDQQLDEVSKDTLSSYAKKASADMHGTWKKATDPTDKDHKKASKRILGMHRAFSKIAKKDMKEDIEQIDELSYDTLNSYMRKKRKVIGKVGDMERHRGTQKGKKMEKDVENYRKAWQKRDMGEEYSTGLLELYANLNDENRADMLEMFENDKDTLMSFVEQFNGGGEE